jgi:transcriptional regulator with XRE-family HTH domain
MPVFSSNLKAWRLSKELTQEELAQKSGVSRPNLVALEQGRRECTLSTLNRLAYVIGISSGTLLDREPPSENDKGLNRHEIDRIARSLFEPGIVLSDSLARLRDQVLSQAGPLLRSSGFKKRTRAKRIRPQDRQSVQQVLERVSKLIPSILTGVAL